MKYWNERISNAMPYIPGEQLSDQGFIKLNTNENPWPPSPHVVSAIEEGSRSLLSRYPDPNARMFCNAAAHYCDVPVEYIFAGNGSDEILAFAFGAFFGRSNSKPLACDAAVVFPDVTYSFYSVFASLWSLSYKELPVADDFSVVPELLCGNYGGVVLCNPNAPTGKALSRQECIDIIEFYARRGVVVVIDEAYAEFGAESVVNETLRYDNILVVRSLSKSKSLAGLRAGYAVGAPVLIDGLKRIRDMFNSYTMNTITQLAGAAALEDEDYYRSKTEELIGIRSRLQERLTKCGWTVLPSVTNFLFISLPGMQGSTLAEHFRASKILVRHWNKPRISNYIRVSIGTETAMERFSAVAEMLAEQRTETVNR